MRLFPLGFIVLLAACDGGVCAGVGRGPGLAVTVIDSLTTAPVATGATLLTYLGSTTIDSVTGTRDDEILYGADDQAGQYRVVVRRSGYAAWEQGGVTVSGSCNSLNRVALTARLARPIR